MGHAQSAIDGGDIAAYDNFAIKNLPQGIDAPTTAREWDLAPHGALTLFFRWRKKSVQKKASGTATTGKRL